MAGPAAAAPPGPGAAGGPPAAAGREMLVAEHVEAKQMGEHVREFRFTGPVALHSVQIVERKERPSTDSSFEGKTFPNVRTMSSLSVYAADGQSSSSTMPRLRPGEVSGSFVPPSSDRLITDCVVIRGEYLRLSVVIWGHVVAPGDAPDPAHALAGVGVHLRPASAYDPEKLDLADFDGMVGLDGDLDFEGQLAGNEAWALVDSGAPASLASALALGTPTEANARLVDHAEWVTSLADQPDVLDADIVSTRLEAVVCDIGDLAQKAPDATAAHISHGPALARALLGLTFRCVERLEFRPLRATLRALAASLCAATTAAEVLKRGGLLQLITIIKDTEWSQLSCKVAAMQALLQLCSHAVGMEAFLGWSAGADAGPGVLPTLQTGYEAVLSLACDGPTGHASLEQICLTLLRRASFYTALARLDGGCARLAGNDDTGDAEANAALHSAVEALQDVAEQLEELSGAVPVQALRPGADAASSFLEAGCPSARTEVEAATKPAAAAALGGCSPASSSSGEPFSRAHPQLHGYLESFLGGRRLVPGLCILLRRFPRLSPKDRLAAFAPLRKLVCALLASVGGSHFLASDAPALATFLNLLDPESTAGGGGAAKGKKGIARDGSVLPAVPRFPEALARCALGAPQLAVLVTTHVRATRIVLMLVARTRQRGRGGVLLEADALPLLAALHQLCARGAAGRDSVVSAFRSVFLVQWLLRQLEGGLEEAAPTSGATQATSPLRPSLRHLVAILHTLVLEDPLGSVAEHFGARILTLSTRALELLEAAEDAEAGGEGRGTCTALDFALDSEGADGGLGRAVRLGRRSADNAFRVRLRELVAQLRPWQQDGDAAGVQEVPTAKLLACLQIPRAPRAFKRMANEDRGSRLSLLLGGYCGAGAAGVEVPEVDFAGMGDAGEHAELADDRERFPPGGFAQLPLLAMRIICRRTALSSRDALSIVLHEEKKDGFAVLIPLLIRCTAALNLNLEALVLREHGDTIDAIYTSQQAHASLLEAALQTCFHLIRCLRDSDLSQYRHTELQHLLLLLADRLTSNLVGVSPGATGSDHEFRLLWRSCLVWTCRVYRAWVQSFPSATGGQLLQPMLRHIRVLPWHFVPGLLLLSTCGSLTAVLPPVPHTFSVVSSGKDRSGTTAGAENSAGVAGEQSLKSRPLLLPFNAHGGAFAHLVVKAQPLDKESPFGKTLQDRQKLWGQLWGDDCQQSQDWDSVEAAAAGRDSLVQALSKKRETLAVASALSLVGRVNVRRERLSLNDFAEVTGLVVQCAVTSNALLHLITVRVLEKLMRVGVPVLEMVIQLGEAVLHGAAGAAAVEVDPLLGAEAAATDAGAGPATGGAARDPRDARAVCRILMFLVHFGERGIHAKRALAEHRAEALCLSVLAHSSGTLPSMAATQAIRVLSLIFCSGGNVATGSYGGQDGNKNGMAPSSVPKCRMVSKALSLLLNRTPEDGPQVGPSAVAAALELLLRLSSTRSMCLNLLFSATEESPLEGAPAGAAIPVAVSCAFRLAQCSQRLARELSLADESWDATARCSDLEAEAEEVLAAWLHVGELLVSLCQTVLVNCPTASVFLAVVLPAGAPPEHSPDEAMLRSVMADVQASLSRITGRTQRAETVPLRAAALVGNLRALQRQLIDTKAGPPPPTLTREELSLPRPGYGQQGASDTGAHDEDASKGNGAGGRAPPPADDDSEVLTDVVTLFDDAADLEADAEWHTVAELDTTETHGEGGGQEWEFDAGAYRRKRKAVLEKLESDRKAKRLKQEAAAGSRRRPAEGEAMRADKVSARGDPGPAATPAAGAPAAAPASTGASPKHVVGALAKSQAAPKPAGANPAEALQTFLKDHPHFMRVIQNPKKSLSDPRVKSMFVNELQNYPAVKAFLASKGLNLS